MRFVIAFLCLVILCASVRAESAEEPTGVLQACLSETDGDFTASRACIGRISDPCINDDDGGATTIGMIRCFQRERDQWLALRHQFIGALQAQESSTQRAQLDAMLAEYARWLEVRCSYGASAYEGGSLSRVAAAACTNRLEGELAIDLWLRVRELSER